MRTSGPRAVLSFTPAIVVGLGLALGIAVLPALAQQKTGPASAEAAVPFSALQGRWVRPDGRYMIAIRSVGADGKLDAAYANPSPMPFSRAEASRDGRRSRSSSSCARAAMTDRRTR